jgi:hypothetical protein
MVDARVGLQFISAGNIVFKDNQPAIRLVVNLPVQLTLGYVKRDESGANTDEEIAGVNYDDVDRYLLDVQWDNADDTISVEGFYLAQTDGSDAEDEPYVFGVLAKATFGKLKTWAEIDSFGGSVGDDDYVGTQMNVNAQMALSDKLTVAGDVFWSDGTDEADEIKITEFGNPFGHYDPVTEFAGLFNPYDGGLHALGNQVFDPFGDSAGAMGLVVGAKFAALENLDLAGTLSYVSATEDIDTAYESATHIGVAAGYGLLPNTTLYGAFATTSVTAQEGDDPDAATNMFFKLQVDF